MWKKKKMLITNISYFLSTVFTMFSKGFPPSVVKFWDFVVKGKNEERERERVLTITILCVQHLKLRQMK